jgi:hypothetical protein
MFEGFVGSFLGVWAVYGILFVKDELDKRAERKYRERVRREQV